MNERARCYRKRFWIKLSPTHATRVFQSLHSIKNRFLDGFLRVVLRCTSISSKCEAAITIQGCKALGCRASLPRRVWYLLCNLSRQNYSPPNPHSIRRIPSVAALDHGEFFQPYVLQINAPCSSTRIHAWKPYHTRKAFVLATF